MASTFAHQSDNTIRIGDYVMTKERKLHGSGSSNFAPSVSQQYSPVSNASMSSAISGSGGNLYKHVSSRIDVGNFRSKSSYRSSSEGGGGSSSTGYNPNVNPTAQAFGADMSSAQACWASMVHGTFLSGQAHESKEGLIVGIVVALDARTAEAHVSVWNKGGETVLQAHREVRPVPLCHLQKISPAEFNQKCKKEYMTRLSYQLKLKAEGYDESAPLALIAHNNRIISSLIDRMPTQANIGKEKLKPIRPRHGGPADLKKLPVPTLIPVEDPLADMRDELKALAAAGVMSKKKKTTGSAKDPVLVQQEEKEMKDVSQVASRMESPAGSAQNVLPVSFVQESMSGEGSRAQSRLSSRFVQTKKNILDHSRGKFLPDSFFPTVVPRETSTQSLGVPTSTQDQCPTPSHRARHLSMKKPDFCSVVSSAASSPSGGLFGDSSIIQCFLLDVADNGTMLCRPRSGELAPFMAILANVMLFTPQTIPLSSAEDAKKSASVKSAPAAEQADHSFLTGVDSAKSANNPSVSDFLDPTTKEAGGSNPQGPPKDGIEALRRLKGVPVEVKILERHVSGIAVVEITTEGGEILSEELVGQGVAVVNVSVLDTAAAFLGPQVAQSLECSVSVSSSMQRLAQAQQQAMQNKVGFWAQGSVSTNFLPIPEHTGGGAQAPDKGLATEMLWMDKGEVEGAPLSSLFSAYESSSLFRGRVAQATKK